MPHLIALLVFVVLALLVLRMVAKLTPRRSRGTTTPFGSKLRT